MSKPMPITGLMSGVALWLSLSGVSAPAQQFSADLVRTGPSPAGPHLSGKLNVSNDKVRIETSDVAAGHFLIIGDAGVAYLLRPAARIFMDARQSSLLTQVFVVVDPDDPCRQWQAAARIAGAADRGAAWSCAFTGHDTVDGRATTKYQMGSPQGPGYFAWVDPALHFPVRLQTEDGSVSDLVNIREAPQPESLFSVPAGYRKFDPQQLIDRIKQSDVWVEPPK